MKKLLQYPLILLTLLTFNLTSCLPEQTITSAELDTESSSEDDDTTEVEYGAPALWYDTSTTSASITLNANNSQAIYLLGDDIHNHLSSTANFGDIYCVEFRFTQSNSAVPKRLRVKATPSYTSNYVENAITRMLKVNIGTSLGNSYCDKSSLETVSGKKVLIGYNDSNYDSTVTSTDVEVVHSLAEVCTDCSSTLTTSSIILYQTTDNDTESDTTDDYLLRLTDTDIDYSALVLRVNINSDSDSSASSCTDSACVADGYDCCVDGQCVNEKGLKSAGIAANPEGFALAETYKTSNANWYKDYPEFYYICLETQTDDTSDLNDQDEDETENPEDEAEERLSALTADYTCLTELAEKSTSNPFHSDPYNSSASYSACNVTDPTDDLYYETVMKRLYTNCGCSEKNDLTTMVSICPAYTYTPTYATDTSGEETDEVTSYVCVTPTEENEDAPFQDLEISVSGRTAPHRFFDTTNNEINPSKDLPSGASGIQEGTEFSYLDTRYIFPQNGNFNMNSLLGQMTTTLDQARPAVTIDVEYDQKYLVSTLEGYYQPCTTCGTDSWYTNFTATPYANDGVGAKAVGFTTRRDTYVTNRTFGNYEDTIFNRACYVPPTMLPFSHTAQDTDQNQRLARLETQAALYINGYQKDWYGFNRGALIGSFDGVTWFAVGKGRIVTATSTKLFLAINAPFADLASNTNHTVAVQEFDNTSTAAKYDYDPSLSLNASTQNEAGSCQAYHMCDTDSECISKLGWEYVCADVSNQQTKWPNFNATGALEVASDEKTGAIQDFLQQAGLPTGSGSKRCVYRGSGAPCRVNFDSISDEGLRKNLTCAPNFYCASLSSSTFNTQVARFGRPLDELTTSKNHIFGQDANVLGRPLHYLNTGSLSNLSADIQARIENNLLEMDSTGAGDFGLCRPGKLLPSYQTSYTTNNWNPVVQHKSADTESRTDFISQIGGCNSALYTDMRYSSCPILDSDGNYVYTQDDFLDDNFYLAESGFYYDKEYIVERLGFSQNACGLESVSGSIAITASTTADEISNYSAFKSIEAKPLSSSNIITEKTLARDACFRKAGAVCHTDLDCSPNRMMAGAIDLVSSTYFGNAAEKTYFEEYLICGQAMEEPSSDDDNFSSYSLANNRCCRPVGQTLTMYTEDSPNSPVSQLINTAKFGALNPNASDRYSRYSSVDATLNASTKLSNIIRPSANTDDLDGDNNLDNTVNITNTYQWQTIHNAAAKTCCGGSWVRKFDDGGNDWSKKRLSIDPTNFKCLNYITPLQRAENAEDYGLTQNQLEVDRDYYCLDGNRSEGGCSQSSFGAINDFSIQKPVLNSISTSYSQIVSSSVEYMTTETSWDVNPFSFTYLQPMDGTDYFNMLANNNSYVLPWSEYNPGGSDTTTDLYDEVTHFNLIVRIPSFVNIEVDADGEPSNFASQLAVTDPRTGNELTCSNVEDNYTVDFSKSCNGTTNGGAGLCAQDDDWAVSTMCPNATAGRDCCYLYDNSTRVLRVAFATADREDLDNYGKYDPAIIINFTPVGSYQYETEAIDPTITIDDTSVIEYRRSSTPGNALYYLERLSKLEYLGIPQMVYEPVYCNDNFQKLVPGIFKEEVDGQALTNVVEFLNHAGTFYDSNSDIPWQETSTNMGSGNYDASILNKNMVATQDMIDHDAVFSDNEFLCCMELGSTIDSSTDASVCCSGHAVTDEDDETKKICKLPAGTDLTVYFNKFVSGEGLSDSYAEITPLETEDFDPRSGQPILSNEVNAKLVDLGEAFCESGSVRRGAAFGDFQAEPVAADIVSDGSSGASREAYLYSIVDAQTDEETTSDANASYDEFATDGFLWNHHYYCDTGE